MRQELQNENEGDLLGRAAALYGKNLVKTLVSSRPWNEMAGDGPDAGDIGLRGLCHSSVAMIDAQTVARRAPQSLR
jgi:hypothetical protein